MLRAVSKKPNKVLLSRRSNSVESEDSSKALSGPTSNGKPRLESQGNDDYNSEGDEVLEEEANSRKKGKTTRRAEGAKNIPLKPSKLQKELLKKKSGTLDGEGSDVIAQEGDRKKGKKTGKGESAPKVTSVDSNERADTRAHVAKNDRVIHDYEEANDVFSVAPVSLNTKDSLEEVEGFLEQHVDQDANARRERLAQESRARVKACLKKTGKEMSEIVVGVGASIATNRPKLVKVIHVTRTYGDH